MIPGFLVSILTFPGIVLHEISHAFFCKLFDVKIYDYKYFQFKNPVGYVTHEDPDNFKQSFFISVGPFIINNLAAIIVFILTTILITVYSNYGLFLGWLGLSLSMQSFPSSGDAKTLWNVTKRHSKENKLLKLVGYPFVIIIYLAHYLKFIWFDFFFAVGLYTFIESFF